jgi:AcrR family transcriptional regulator
MARTAAPGTRERILASADRLFYENGIRAVGLQQVIDDCGCGKNLLYREFAGKDDLIAAYLDGRDRQWREAVAVATAPLADDPAGQILAIVGVVADQVRAPDYHGCPFLKAHAEYADRRHPGRRIPVEHLRELTDQLRALATRARLQRPGLVAERILVVVQGMYATGAVLGDAFVRSAVAFAEEIVADAAPA